MLIKAALRSPRQRRLAVCESTHFVVLAVHRFSEFIGGDRTPTIISSNGSFCIIYNSSVNANN
ncbi:MULTISPECIES: hypothetical protein [unclassified Microcoleus]|uniref:hypothetical protein n=1 Tax=unclassified Microcoleus TaxID=2642155 RepID=UPI002FCF584A